MRKSSWHSQPVRLAPAWPSAAEPTGGPGEPTCQAAVISYAVQVGTGRRSAAEFFFGDYPRAVQDAERAVQDFCASHQ